MSEIKSIPLELMDASFTGLDFYDDVYQKWLYRFQTPNERVWLSASIYAVLLNFPSKHELTLANVIFKDFWDTRDKEKKIAGLYEAVRLSRSDSEKLARPILRKVESYIQERVGPKIVSFKTTEERQFFAYSLVRFLEENAESMGDLASSEFKRYAKGEAGDK